MISVFKKSRLPQPSIRWQIDRFLVDIEEVHDVGNLVMKMSMVRRLVMNEIEINVRL